MDFFGIGAGIEGAVKIYFQSARRTGRTISLINSLKTGDRIVFHNEKEARRVSNLCKEKGINIKYIIVPINNLSKIFEKGSSQGRTIFDHLWVEKYYLAEINKIKNEITSFQLEVSGWNEAHEKTRQQAKEYTKWNI